MTGQLESCDATRGHCIFIGHAGEMLQQIYDKNVIEHALDILTYSRIIKI